MIIGPITLQAKIHFKGEDGTLGHADYSFPAGKPIDQARIEKALKEVKGLIPEGYELLEPADFLNHVVVKDATGQAGDFAVPAEYDYDLSKIGDDR